MQRYFTVEELFANHKNVLLIQTTGVHILPCYHRYILNIILTEVSILPKMDK